MRLPTPLNLSCLDKRSDISVTIGERLQPIGVGGSSRHVVRHEQARIADLFVKPDRLDKVNIAFVREDLNELIAMASDIPEVNIENLPASSEVANDVEDLLPWII